MSMINLDLAVTNACRLQIIQIQERAYCVLTTNYNVHIVNVYYVYCIVYMYCTVYTVQYIHYIQRAIIFYNHITNSIYIYNVVYIIYIIQCTLHIV